MIIKRAIAVESLTKVCEESLTLIKQLIEADNAVYGKGYEDGIAAQAKVQQTLRPWVGLTEEEIKECFKITPDQHLPWQIYKRIEKQLRERNEKT